MNNVLMENDKENAPFLLAASFSGLINYVGCSFNNGVLYWNFSPRSEALSLIEQFKTKKEPNIPAKDIFEAIATWWKQVSQVRNGEIKNELSR